MHVQEVETCVALAETHVTLEEGVKNHHHLHHQKKVITQHARLSPMEMGKMEWLVQPRPVVNMATLSPTKMCVLEVAMCVVSAEIPVVVVEVVCLVDPQHSQRSA